MHCMFIFLCISKNRKLLALHENIHYTSKLMSKMFRIGVLSVAVCIGVSAESSKADFEADLQSVLSIESRGFSEEVFDPMYWIKACTDSQEADKADKNLQEADKLYEDLRKVYEAYEELYEEFGTGVREIESGFTAKMMSVAENDPDAFVKRSLYLLELARDLYGKVFNYSDWAWETLVADEDGEWIFKNVDPLILLECFYVFERRVLGLSRYAIQHHITKTLGLGDYINTKDREPDLKVLADILKSFAKGDACRELQSNGNDSMLVQKNNIFAKTFHEFSRKNKGMLEEAKETFGAHPLESWFEVSKSGKGIDYLNGLTMQPWNFIDALQALSRDASECVARMVAVKLSAELKKEALPFFKGEKDVGELLKAAESFRIKEKIKRQKAQNDFAEANGEREKLERELIATVRALKEEKKKLSKARESNVEFSDEGQREVEALKAKSEALEEVVRTLKKQINKLPYPSVKSKHKMQRKAAKEDITKEEHDMAVLANYVQLPGRCDALLNAFLYYQTIMWNVFTDGVEKMRKYGEKIYMGQNIAVPQLTDDFEEEYRNLVKGIWVFE